MQNLQFIYIREQVIKAVRDFFYDRKFHEVITPVLNKSIPLEPNIYPFTTEWNTAQGDKRFYLATSPEKNLKFLLAFGIGNCFSIGHSFRNLEAAGSLHTPEFLMLEWYRKNADYKVIMDDVKSLIMYIQKVLHKPQMYNRLNDWSFHSLVTLFKQYAKLDLIEITHKDRKLFEYAKKKGYQTIGATWNELYDQIFVSEIEPHFPKDPFFLTDFPNRISPLCKPKKSQPYLAERFELYIGGIELGNGNTENTDYQSVLKIFKAEQKKRKKQGTIVPSIDKSFLDALKKMNHTLYSGVGLGIDRLILLFANTNYIKFV